MKKREPIDLVGRLASRLDLKAPEPAEPPVPVEPTLEKPVFRVASPVAKEPRIVGRAAPRIEPTFTPRPQPTVVRADVRAEAGVVPEIGVPPATPADIAITAPTAEAPVMTPVAPVAAPDVVPSADAAVITELTPPSDERPSIAAVDAVDRTTDAAGRNVVELNLVRLQKDGFLTPQNQRSLIAEEYRIIKRPLLRKAFDHVNEPGNLNHVVMITSARPEEGKTFTAINLAMSVATERDLFVLLVDCDIRRMGLSKKLGVADRKGLMDVLMDPQVSVSDVILRTNIPNLAIIPSGQPVEASTEILASAQMTALVDDIASRYPDRFIIFDAPPVLASSEPGVLAVHVGQTVMVVHANETSKRAIAQSIPLINGCPNVHFVLNRVTIAAGPDRFGYYGTY